MSNLQMRTYQIRNVNDVINHDNRVIWYPHHKNLMYLNWKIRPNNYDHIYYNTTKVQSFDAADFDNDLFISLGFTDGFTIRRLNDDGTLELLFTDSGPINTNGGVSLALDKENHKAYVSTYSKDGVEVYNYSGVTSGGTLTPFSEGVLTVANDNLPINRAGYQYFNGLKIVGDYLYMANISSGNIINRWHIPTQTTDNLSIINIGSNGYRGYLKYDNKNDRLYCINEQNGDLWLILSASTSADTAKCYHVDASNFLEGADIYVKMCVVDNDNANYVWLSTEYGRFAKFDITNSITGTGDNPSAINYNNNLYNVDGNNIPWIGLYGYHIFTEHPVYGSKLILGFPDRGYNTNVFWFDQDKKLTLAKGHSTYIQYPEGTIEYGIPGTSASFDYDYMNFSIGISSGTSQKYTLVYGSGGSHGGTTFVYNNSKSFEFEDSGYIIFGNYTLYNNQDIGAILISNLDMNTPDETSIEIWVTNNSGLNWESYDFNLNKHHIFKNRGNISQVKFILKTNLPYKSPNFNSVKYPIVTIRGYDELENPTRYKTSANKINGLI